MLTRTVLAATVAMTVTHAGQSPVAVTYSRPTPLTLHEPVIVTVTFLNLFREAITIDLGWNRLMGFALTVRRPDRQVERPRITPSDLGRAGRITIEPNGQFSQTLVLNNWLPFDQSGSYQVEIQIVAPMTTASGTTVSAPASDTIQIDIGERDAGALRSTCQRLADIVVSPVATAAQADERFYAARALGYVTDPVAVPIFRSILDATTYEDAMVLEALRQIGTPEAVEVLQEMSGRGGDRGTLARNALRRLKD